MNKPIPAYLLLAEHDVCRALLDSVCKLRSTIDDFSHYEGRLPREDRDENRDEDYDLDAYPKPLDPPFDASLSTIRQTVNDLEMAIYTLHEKTLSELEIRLKIEDF